MMFNLEENALVTITPDYPPPACGATRFRWNMNVSLPFPLPAKKCFNEELSLHDKRYSFGIHNHLDRMHRTSDKPSTAPCVYLAQKLSEGEQEQPTACEYRITREHLQSVAVFTDLGEYASPKEAFEEADKKIKTCLDALADRLARIQRSLPYAVSWTVYPVSVFDVGMIHHAVDHFCPKSGTWSLVGCGVALSLARQLRVPLFTVDFPEDEFVPAQLSLANELLAESQMSIFRRLPRLTVLNACAAVEILANWVYKQKRYAQLVDEGHDEIEAEAMADDDRKRSRTDETFLLHSGLRKACGRSLCKEHKALYDAFLRHESERHQTAHRGQRPAMEAAKSCFHHCCEVVRWLCTVAALPTKPMLPPPDEVIPGLAVASGEPHVCSGPEMELMRWMFNVVNPPRHEGEGADSPAEPSAEQAHNCTKEDR